MQQSHEQAEETRDELQEASRKNKQLEQDKKSLKKEKREYQIRHMLLETENDLKEQKVAILEESLSTVKAILVDTTTVNRELLGEVKKLKGAQEETDDRLDAVEASADENREDFGNLKNDVEGLATEQQQLAGDVAAENQRRELKEYELDNNMHRLEQGVADNKEKTEELEDKIVDEDMIDDKIDTARKNATNDAIDFMHGDLAEKQGDIEAHNHRLENDVSTVKDEMEELREQAAAARATVTRRRRRVKVLSIQNRNRNFRACEK